MKKIKVEIEISNVNKWSVDWGKEANKHEALKELNYDIKIALYEKVGIDMDSMVVKSELLTQENE